MLQVTHDINKNLPQNQGIFPARLAKLLDYFSEFEEILDVLATIQITYVSLLSQTLLN